MRRCLSITLISVALLLSACNSPEESTTDPTGETPSSTSIPLPGIQAMGLTNEEFAQYVEEVESLIASCMADAGFEYVPVDVSSVLEVGLYIHADPELSREEYKSQWGYGISTRFDNPPRDVGLGPQNLRIYEDLSEADQIAYDRTLFGDDPDATFAVSLDDEDFTNLGGCTEEAVEAVFPPEILSADFINPKDVLIESDPRVIAADEAWVECMEEAGYEGYEDQDDIIEEYKERLETVTEGDDPETLIGPALEALETLQSEEIAIALRDLECQGPLDEVIREVEIELYGFPVSG